MEIIPGGIRNMIVADNAAFDDYKVIDVILKRGTSIVPGTDLEEGSENEMLSAGKNVSVKIVSADYTEALYDFLSAAELSRTPLYFRLFTMSSLYYCDVLNVVSMVDRGFAESGKFNSVDITGRAHGAKETDVISLVYMFNPFNPENL